MAFDFKGANPAELNHVWKKMASEMKDDRLGTKKELRYLPEALVAGEQVLAFASGMVKSTSSTWLLVLTDRRILMLDKGMLYGLRQVSIPLEKVNSITGHTGLMLGSITVEDGASSREISNMNKQVVQIFVERAQKALESAQNMPRNEIRHQPSDSISQLERLANLKEKGILTEDEFVAQKAKILS